MLTCSFVSTTLLSELSVSSSLRRSVTATAIALAVLLLTCISTTAAPKAGYQSFIVGNPADAQPSNTLSPGLR
jgi:hypothetical protein